MKDWIYGEIDHLSWSWWWWWCYCEWIDGYVTCEMGFGFLVWLMDWQGREQTTHLFLYSLQIIITHWSITKQRHRQHASTRRPHALTSNLRNLNSHSHSTRRKSKDLVYFKLLAWIISHFISAIILIVLFLCSRRKSHKRCDLLRFLVFGVLPCAQSTSSCERSRQIEFFITQICLMDPKMKFAT